MTIYFISDGENVKIGYTDGGELKRLGAFQTGNAKDLTLLGIQAGSPDDETRLHGQFSACHVRGEWFRLEPQLLEYIDQNVQPVKMGGQFEGSKLCRAMERAGVDVEASLGDAEEMELRLKSGDKKARVTLDLKESDFEKFSKLCKGGSQPKARVLRMLVSELTRG